MATQDVKTTWLSCFNGAKTTLEQFVAQPENIELCSRFSQILIDTYKKGGTVFSCGNGGSHCDAMHFAEEMTGRYRKDRKPLGALALGDASHVTCTANDYGFQYIFARQLEGLARSGDALIAISTSGNSQNVIEAVQIAKSKKMPVIGLLGKDGGKLKSMVDVPLIIAGSTADRIQEMHIKLIHSVIETVERELFPDHYA